MDPANPVIALCIAGAEAEFERRLEDAQALYERAWEARTDDYEACIAAHYVARFQDSATEALRWNQLALTHAEAVGDERVVDFLPSLYLSLAGSYEQIGDIETGRTYRARATSCLGS